MNEPKIMSGIAIPAKGSTKRAVQEDILARRMAVGDCVELSFSAGRALYATLRRIGFKAVVRKQPDGNLRVWKVAP